MHSSKIDYDEIDSLVRGIDYIMQIKPSVTKMKQFEAHYKTADDLRLITYNSGEDIKAAVESGVIGKTRAFLKLEDLAKLKELILSAKDAIDKAKAAR